MFAAFFAIACFGSIPLWAENPVKEKQDRFSLAVECIKRFEGWHGEKRHWPYVGYGHKVLPGERLTNDITKEQGDSILRADLRKLCRIFSYLGRDSLLLSEISDKSNGVTYKSRLKEIGISEWRFYESKRKYAEAQASERESGEFLQLVRGNDSFPEPVLTNRKAGRGRKPVYESGPMSIEMRTQTGTVLRIQGNLDATMIQAIIQASSSHV